MTENHLFAAIVSVAALASYLNYRFLRFPAAIGLMAIALALSVLLVILARFTSIDAQKAISLVSSINFNDLLLHGMLPFLLFAGALSVDLRHVRDQLLAISILPTVGVAIATLITGWLFWLACGLVGMPLTLAECFLFGALIAPTDPIAVLGILRDAKVPKPLETMISGESLFNDGVGVVVFLTIYGVLYGGSHPGLVDVMRELVIESVGGIAFGTAIGWCGYRLLRTVNTYPVEIFLTLAVAAGGYAAAEGLHVSAPLAIVAAGLVIGSVGRSAGMSKTTKEHLDSFWEVVDEMLNAVLFLLVGLEMMVVLDIDHLGLGALAIIAVLVGRLISVALPLVVIGRFVPVAKGAVTVLTWGGLRGGISLALAMSLPAGKVRDVILTVTYVVVVFSILVQGLSLRPVVMSSTRSDAT